MKANRRLCSIGIAVIALCFAPRTGLAQIYVTNYGSLSVPPSHLITGVGAFTLSGAPINPQLITDSRGTLGVAVSGSKIFVANSNNFSVSTYTTSGAPLSTPLITTNFPSALAIDNGSLYIASFGASKVSKYTTDGAVVNSTLFSSMPGSPLSIAVADGKVFTTSLDGNGGGYVSVHSTEGVPISTPLISGLKFPGGIAVSGDYLYIAESNAGRISKYSLNGTLVTQSLIPDLHTPRGIAIVGDLYVVNTATYSVGHYTTSGATINGSLITGLGNAADLDRTTLPNLSGL